MLSRNFWIISSYVRSLCHYWNGAMHFPNSMWITGSVSETRIHAFADRGELMGCST